MVTWEQLEDPTFKIPLDYFITTPVPHDPTPRNTSKQYYRSEYGSKWKVEWKKYKKAQLWHETKAKHAAIMRTQFIEYELEHKMEQMTINGV